MTMFDKKTFSTIGGAIAVGGIGAYVGGGIGIAALGTAVAGTFPLLVVGALLGGAAGYVGTDIVDRLTEESEEPETESSSPD